MFISLEEEEEFEAVGNDFYTPKKRGANGFFRFQRKLVGIQNKWRFKGISYAEQGISKLVNDRLALRQIKSLWVAKKG